MSQQPGPKGNVNQAVMPCDDFDVDVVSDHEEDDWDVEVEAEVEDDEEPDIEVFAEVEDSEPPSSDA